MPVRPSTPVHQAIAAAHGEVAIGEEPVAEAQSVGDLLALLVGVRRHGDDLDAGSLGLR